ncbi:protein smoothened-like [Littorina saxatilis]|uniref:protein smoothened-like n=1 Tax=Littorina saxatilis TaxID=31220 RepID=UPI0038B64EB1
MNQQNPPLRIPASQRLTVRRFSLSTLSTVLLQSLFINLQLQFTPVSTQTTCHQNGVTCLPLSGPGTAPPTCYGASLKFSHTAVLWVNDSSDSGSLSEVTSRLRLWEGLSSVPECWAVVQPFLCSVYIPRCDDSNGRLDYPSLELCERIREPCKLVKKFATDWPESLRCSKPYFKQNCGTGAYAQLTYNTTGRCDVPLVRTETEDSWWEGLEGCGVQCDDPLFTDEDHKHAHAFVTIMGGLCLASTLFTLFTFMIDWENASRYPALILFFVNFCFLLATVGWMAQFSNGARQDIVCRVDGTQRKAEPRLGSGETASCTVVFVMIYYFTMAGLLWFVMLCYAWHVTFRALGTPRDDLSSKTAYFHLVSWTIPLVLTIVCLAISEVRHRTASPIASGGIPLSTVALRVRLTQQLSPVKAALAVAG